MFGNIGLKFEMISVVMLTAIPYAGFKTNAYHGDPYEKLWNEVPVGTFKHRWIMLKFTSLYVLLSANGVCGR